MANLKIIRGDSTNINVTFTDENSDPVNITGKTIFFTAKNKIDEEVDDSDAVITKDVITHSNPTAGQTVIALTADDTSVPIGEYFYDIQMVGDGQVLSIERGILEVLQDVTKRIAITP